MQTTAAASLCPRILVMDDVVQRTACRQDGSYIHVVVSRRSFDLPFGLLCAWLGARSAYPSGAGLEAWPCGSGRSPGAADRQVRALDVDKRALVRDGRRQRAHRTIVADKSRKPW